MSHNYFSLLCKHYIIYNETFIVYAFLCKYCIICINLMQL